MFNDYLKLKKAFIKYHTLLSNSVYLVTEVLY